MAGLQAAPDNKQHKRNNNMNEALLVVSFGTTHLDTLEKNITKVEEALAQAAGLPCFRAFTSRIVRKRLGEKYGITVPGIAEALVQIREAGFDSVLIQPTLLLPGEEYDLLRQEAEANAEGLTIRMGQPLLVSEQDLKDLTMAIRFAYTTPVDTVLLAMGHGTSHAADATYTRLRRYMQALGMELCTVEGSIDFAAAVEALKAGHRRKVHLVPLLLVAGDHSQNDMAGSEEGSLRCLLEQAGFTVSWSLQGLGEIAEVRNLYCRHLKQLLEQ